MMSYRGAYATIQWVDNKEVVNGCYISFCDGGWDAEKECDSFGISDHDIFYFCEKGEEELKGYMTEPFEFKVLDYTLVEVQK